MTTNFPNDLDDFGSVPRNQNSLVKHHERHENVEDAIEAVQAYVGATNSAVPTSLTYKINQLLSSIGSSLIGFIQAGVGAVFRTAQDKMRERVTPEDFGAVCDGVTNDTPAILRAIAYAQTRNFAEIELAAGTYLCTAEVVIALTGQSGLSIRGKGSSLTELRFNTPSGNGVSVSSPSGNWWINVSPHNKFSLEGVSITTLKANVGTGLFLNMGSLEGRPCPSMTLTDVEVRGATGFVQYFAKSFDFLDTTGVAAYNCWSIIGGPGNVNGIGFDIRASGPTTDPTNIRFLHCGNLFGNKGWQSSDYVEGIYLTQCDSINSNNAVYWHAGSESGLHVVGGHFNTFGNAFDLDGIFDGAINGALIFSAGGASPWAGIKARNGGSMTFNNNVIRASNVAGVNLIDIDEVPNEGTHGYVVNGNMLSGGDVGIVLGLNSRKSTVGINNFLNVNTRVINQGASTNYVFKREYCPPAVIATVGGAPTEVINVPLPVGLFTAKPGIGFVSSATQDLVGIYDYAAGGSTATNAVVRLRKLDGTNIGAGPNRMNILFKEE